MKKINYYQTENICWYFLFTFSLSGCWEEKLETLKQRRICCYSFCGTQSCCYNCLEEIILLLYTLHLPFHVVFVNIPLISRFAPEIMLCILRVLPYRLSIPDYRLLKYYYRFRILLNPSQITVADPCLASYILNPSIVLDNLAPCLTTGAPSLRKKDVYDNLAPSLTTGATSLRK